MSHQKEEISANLASTELNLRENATWKIFCRVSEPRDFTQERTDGLWIWRIMRGDYLDLNMYCEVISPGARPCSLSTLQNMPDKHFELVRGYLYNNASEGRRGHAREMGRVPYLARSTLIEESIECLHHRRCCSCGTGSGRVAAAPPLPPGSVEYGGGGGGSAPVMWAW